MEFTQHLDHYEHARCVDTVQWKCIDQKVGVLQQMQKDWPTGLFHSKRKKKTLNSPSCVDSMSVGSRAEVKQVVKQVIVPFLVVRQKKTKMKRRGKDGRLICARKKASAGEGFKEQLWKVVDLDKAFDLWETRTSPRNSGQNSRYPKKLESQTLQYARGWKRWGVGEAAEGRSQEENGLQKSWRQVSSSG